MSSLKEEITKRRTFAIISHPDAGKTTLTEKFLLSYCMVVQLIWQALLRVRPQQDMLYQTGWR